jgi:hypothetical protein
MANVEPPVARRFDPESIDLAVLTRRVRAALPSPPRGPITGRTEIRDAVGTILGCSALEAEAIVETMIGRGFAVFDADDGLGGGAFRFRPEAP